MSSSGSPLMGNIVDYLFEPSLGGELESRAFLATPTGDVSFGQLYARVCQVGNMLKGSGVEPGDRVLFSVLDGVDFLALFLGAIKIGAVGLPINTFLTAKDYEYYIRDSGAKAVITDQSVASLIATITQRQPIDARVFIVGDDKCGFESFEEAMHGQPVDVPTYSCGPDDVAFWLYSSGSTGAPKGVVHTHRHIHASTELFGLRALGISSDDVLICPPKMFFAFGLGFQAYMSLRACARVIVNPAPARPVKILDDILKHRPTLFVAVPTLFTGLLDLMRDWGKEQIGQAFGRLRFSVSGGEVLAPSVSQSWKEKTGTEILDGVGTTEMTHMFVINRPGSVVPGSCGRTVDGYTVRLVDDNWVDVPVGEIGNMFAVGPSASQSYWNKPEKTASTMRDGGVLTGDKFYQDKDGNFFYVGRNDDMLRAGGIWISPAEIESTLLEHPAVSECAVIGVENEDHLVKPKAYIVLRSGIEAAPETEDDIRKLVRDKLAHYKCPRWMQFVDSLPKTATGKIQRFKLREMENAGTQQESKLLQQRA